ncbi:DUF5058 family protein [Clostridium sp. D2Q-14]|uniref:DUF5058 family protein n=1 Tax=Anaeromonas gelatinilytica TaxID=2683194 RepID=UPI00193B06B4|nr:DUF5058 family protein [Anaeromonas gelatinilytica]MBS4536468.1 DUF5058 family protein [Anaeromonas gelatinilytica]
MSSELEQIVNSPGLWLASALMVIAVAAMAVIFFNTGLKEAKRIQIPKERYGAGIRSAAISAIGPSISPVIILLSMVALVGAPTTWMRLSDVGAGRTEIAVISMAANAVGAEAGTASFGIEAFTSSLWAMALNNFGWLFVVLALTHRMDKGVELLYSKFDSKWIKMLLAGSTLGLFGYLLTSQLISRTSSNVNYQKIVAVLAAAVVTLIITKAFPNNKRLKEVSLGISMIVGMAVAQILFK